MVSFPLAYVTLCVIHGVLSGVTSLKCARQFEEFSFLRAFSRVIRERQLVRSSFRKVSYGRLVELSQGQSFFRRVYAQLHDASLKYAQQ